MLVYCIVRYTALDVWRCDLCYMFHALTICLGGRRETTSLTIIDRREQCFIYISGCKIRTLPMRIEMYLGCTMYPKAKSSSTRLAWTTTAKGECLL